MIIRRFSATLLAIGLVLACTIVTAQAQANITGSIRGTVIDDAGGFLPGATVVVTGQALGKTPRVTITDSEGAFMVQGLPVGVYSMTVTMIG